MEKSTKKYVANRSLDNLIRNHLSRFLIIVFALLFIKACGTTNEIGLEISTYVGGEKKETIHSLVTDLGDVYVAGTTYSRFINLSDGRMVLAPQCDISPGGNLDCQPPGTPGGVSEPLVINAFIAKYDEYGKMKFFRFIGGNGIDEAGDMVLGNNGTVWLTGSTTSLNFPVTSGAYRTTKTDDLRSDAFIVQIDGNDSEILYASYLGGSGIDKGLGIDIDADGNIYVAGRTGSDDLDTTLPTTATNGNQLLGDTSGFLMVIDTGTNDLIHGRYIGGSGVDEAVSVVVDMDGNTYVTGSTNSPDLASAGAIRSQPEGASDAFLVKYNNSGEQDWFTYHGGMNEDKAKTVTLNYNGEPIIAGKTRSADMLVSPNAYFSTFQGGQSDGFVTHVQEDGTQIIYSSYMGASGDDGVNTIFSEAHGYYLAGWTSSTDFPSSSDALSDEIAGGKDAFILHFFADSTDIEYGTFLGGSNDDMAADISVMPNGTIWVAGSTESDDFPTMNADNSLFSGDQNGFLTKVTPMEYLPVDLGIDVSAPEIANQEDPLEYEIIINNYSAREATVVEMDFEADIGLEVVSAFSDDPGTGCQINPPRTVKCVTLVLDPNGGINITILTQPQYDGERTSHVEVTGAEYDPNLSNNSDSATTEILPKPTLYLEMVEVTQGIQNWDHDVHLVTNKPTSVRVFAYAKRGQMPVSASGVSAEITGPNGETIFPDTAPVLDIAEDGMERGEASHTFNFSLPTDWIDENYLDFQVILSAPDHNYSTGINDWSNMYLRFWDIPPICLTTIPVETQSGSPPAGFLNNPLGPEMWRLAESLLPAPEIKLYMQSNPISKTFGFGTYELPDNKIRVLTSIVTRATFTSDPDECDNARARTHYAGMVLEQDNSGSQGLANGTVSPGPSHHQWFTLNTTEQGTDKINSPFGGRTLAHELGHNYGRKHVDCNGPSDTTDNYPFDPCRIGPDESDGFFGFDSRPAFRVPGRSYRYVAIDPSVGDLMSYASTRWTSSYKWRILFMRLLCQSQNICAIPPEDSGALLMSMAGDDGSESEPIHRTLGLSPDLQQQVPSEVIYATGVLNLERMILEEIQAMHIRSDLFPSKKIKELLIVDGNEYDEERDQEYIRLELLGENDRLIEQYRLPLSNLSGTEGTNAMFEAAVPLAQNLKTIVFRYNEQEVVRQDIMEGSPEVNIIQPASGESVGDTLRIVWESEPSEELEFIVQYTPDEGKTWTALTTNYTLNELTMPTGQLPGSDGAAMIRVIANNGFHTGYATSGLFSVQLKKPEVQIDHPENGALYPANIPIHLEGWATDSEDGWLNGEALAWHFEDGERLGTGRRLTLRNLKPGTHKVILEGIDSDGMSNQDSIIFTVASANIAMVLAEVGRERNVVQLALDQFDHHKTTETGLLPINGDIRDVAIHYTHAFAITEHGLVATTITSRDSSEIVSEVALKGKTQSIVVGKNRAYVAAGEAGIHTIDISQPENLRRLSTVLVDNGAEQIIVKDSVAFVATGSDTISVMSLTNRGLPVEIAKYGSQDLQYLSGMYAHGNYLYLANRRNGLMIIDVSQPAEPEKTGVIEVGQDIRSVAVKGDFAFVIDGSDLRVIDISDPVSPVQKESISLSRLSDDLEAAFPYLYVSGNGTGIRVFSVDDDGTITDEGRIASAIDVIRVRTGIIYR